MVASIIGAAAGLAGSLLGGYKASKAMKKVRRLMAEQSRDNRNWYDRRMNQDYNQTAEAQDAMRRTREYADQLLRRAEGNRIVNGGTDEALATAQRVATQAVGDTMAGIATAGTQTKDAVEQQYIENRRALQQQKMGYYLQKAREISKAVF